MKAVLNFADFKDIFETAIESYPQIEPAKGVAAGGRPRTLRPHKAVRRFAAMASRPDIRKKS
jgi:hypothetical protein